MSKRNNVLFFLLKHAAFFQKLKAEREKSCAEKDKAKISYDEACLHIQNTRNKYLKGDQDKVFPFNP